MFLFRLLLFATLFAAVSLGSANTLLAVPRNPPPVFETEYTLPETLPAAGEQRFPLVSITAENYAAAALYALFLLFAGLAAHRFRSRKMLFCLAVVSVTIFGFAQQGCPCPVGMFQNLVSAATGGTVGGSLSVILLFTLPLLAALFYGRIFCSAVCPLGALQELTAFNLGGCSAAVGSRTEHVLGLFRYFWLGIGVFCTAAGLGYAVCRFDPFIGFFRLSGASPVLLFGGAVLIFGFFVGRPFCRFMCPYGALLGLCGSLSYKKVTVTPGECTKCNLCEHVCPYNAILPPTVLPTPLERRRGPAKLLLAAAALPVLAFGLAAAGERVLPALAPLHRDVRTAQLLHAEEEKLVETSGTFSETRAIAQLGIPPESVYRQALTALNRFRTAGWYLGFWFGLVIGVKGIALVLRRRRTEYEVDPARCFACGRCFWYCPNQKTDRLLLLPPD